MSQMECLDDPNVLSDTEMEVDDEEGVDEVDHINPLDHKKVDPINPSDHKKVVPINPLDQDKVDNPNDIDEVDSISIITKDQDKIESQKIVSPKSESKEGKKLESINDKKPETSTKENTKSRVDENQDAKIVEKIDSKNAENFEPELIITRVSDIEKESVNKTQATPEKVINGKENGAKTEEVSPSIRSSSRKAALRARAAVIDQTLSEDEEFYEAPRPAKVARTQQIAPSKLLMKPMPALQRKPPAPTKSDSDDSIIALDDEDPLADPLGVSKPSNSHVDPRQHPKSGIVYVDTKSILDRRQPIIPDLRLRPHLLGSALTAPPKPPKLIQMGGSASAEKVLPKLPPGITLIQRPPLPSPSIGFQPSRQILVHQLQQPLTSQLPISSPASLGPQPPMYDNPFLTPDAVVMEAPSLIIDYIFERPPKETVEVFQASIDKLAKELNKSEPNIEGEDVEMKETETTSPQKKYVPHPNYFESQLGKFVTELGLNLVQEYFQSDVLSKLSRKNRSARTDEINESIESIKKNLEVTKKKNQNFRFVPRKCGRCPFHSESLLVLDSHEQMPHMKNGFFYCTYCRLDSSDAGQILVHMRDVHGVKARLEAPPAKAECSLCVYEADQRKKVNRHMLSCEKRFDASKNQAPLDWIPIAKVMKTSVNTLFNALSPGPGRPPLSAQATRPNPLLPSRPRLRLDPRTNTFVPTLQNSQPLRPPVPPLLQQLTQAYNNHQASNNMLQNLGAMATNASILLQTMSQLRGLQNNANMNMRFPQQPLTPPLTHVTTQSSAPASVQHYPGPDAGFVICEICDGFIKDLIQLKQHMNSAHQIKIHPRMIYQKPPLTCQKCPLRYFTDVGLERHLLGTHSLVTPMMKAKANRRQDSGRCPTCGKSFTSKILEHMSVVHRRQLKQAHLAYRCSLCSATFILYKHFEDHVYAQHGPATRKPSNTGPGPLSSKSKPGPLSSKSKENSNSVSNANNSVNADKTISGEITLNSDDETSTDGSDVVTLECNEVSEEMKEDAESGDEADEVEGEDEDSQDTKQTTSENEQENFQDEDPLEGCEPLKSNGGSEANEETNSDEEN